MSDMTHEERLAAAKKAADEAVSARKTPQPYDPNAVFVPIENRYYGEEAILPFLQDTAEKIAKTALSETSLFLQLNIANLVYCLPPFSRAEIRDLSLTTWDRLREGGAQPSPGDYDEVEQENTDVGFGKHFIREYGHCVRYNPDTAEWLYYDRGVWHVDADNVGVTTLMKELFEDRLQVADRVIAELTPRFEPLKDFFFDNGNPRELKKGQAPLSDEELSLAKAWFKALEDRKEALAGASARRQSAALEMARAEPGIAVKNEAWDADPMLLNVYAHTVDLRSGVRSQNRNDLLTLQSLVDLNPGAPCKRFQEVLATSLPDAATREYLQDFAGLCLSGIISPDILIFLGEGANGKGLIVKIISGVLGPYAAKCSMSSFLATKNTTPGGARTDLANLRGKRLVTAAEANRKMTLDMELLKDFTGGEDFNARNIYQTASKGVYRPQAKLILSMNNPPRITDQSHATWRRLRYIKFDVIIAPEKRNEKLADELLRTEGGGIFNWMLRGWTRVKKRLDADSPALVAPASVLANTEQYKEDENQAARFFEDNVMAKKAGEVRGSDLYARYLTWCNINGEYRMSQKSLTAELKRYCTDKGLKTEWGLHKNTGSYHRGIELRDTSPEAQIEKAF
jgi:P4 family phage/plasmid primase-like protien